MKYLKEIAKINLFGVFVIIVKVKKTTLKSFD